MFDVSHSMSEECKQQRALSPVLPGNTEGGLVGKRADNRPTQRPIHLKWEFMGELCNTFSNHTLDTLVHIYVEVIGARRNFSLK